MARVNLSDTESPGEQDKPEASSGGPKPPTRTRAPEPAPPAEKVPRGQVAGKEKLQPYVTIAVAESARNAVVATTPFEGGYVSLSELIEDAIKEKVARLERKFNNSQPFPERPHRLKKSRTTSR